MKVVAIYGSSRKKGFSAAMVDETLRQLECNHPKVEKFYLTDMDFKPCIGCFSCRRKEECVLKDDMTHLFHSIIESDFVIFSSPVYCFDMSSTFKKMFERLYPMLAGGMALGEGLQKYTYRYPRKKCMLILAQGAPGFMCRNVAKRAASNLKMNGFDNLGTVICNNTYCRKTISVLPREQKKIAKTLAKLQQKGCTR